MGVYRRPTTTPVPADETQMGVFRNNAIQLTPPPPPPPAAVAPVNTVAPVISGSATRGSTLTAVAGTWTGNPTPTVTGNWLRNGFAIAGAGNLTYVTVEADEGLPIRYYEAGVNSAGAAAAYSNIITVTAIAGALPTVTTRPSISVALPVAVGSILTRVVGAYGDGTPIAGRWQRDGVDIAGATSATYAVVTADVGHIIRFIETVSNAYGEIEAVSDGLTVVVEVTQTSALQTVIMNLQPDINTVSISRQDGGISTYINAAGTLVRPSNNVSRYHFSSGVFQGLYVEKAASNLCAYGRSIGDVGWSVVGSGVTVTAYDAVAPTGATEATRLQIAATSGFAGLFYQASNASGILRNSMWARSRTGVNQVIWMRHPTNGLEEVTVTPTWQRFDKIGQNQDGSNFNIHIIQANNDPVDIELFGVDLCPNGTADDSLIATQSTLGNRPNESLTITLNAAARNGIRDVLVTFDNATTQAFTSQSVGLGWNVNATQLTRRLVRQIEIFNSGSLIPTPTPTPTPPPASGSISFGRVAMIGDSLFRGWLANPGDSSAPIYAPGNRLRILLQSAGHSLTFIGTEAGVMDPGGWDVTAVGGWTISDVSAKTASVAALNPNVVIVSIGTNNLASLDASIGASILAYLQGLETSLSAIPIYVCIPVNLSWMHQLTYTQLKNTMTSWCDGGTNRHLIDLNALGMDVESGVDGNGDGTHWSETGANKVAAAIYTKMLETTTSSVPAPSPPASSTSLGDIYDVETVISDMIDPNDSYYYIEAAPHTAEQLFDNNRYAYLAVGRKRGIPGYDPYGASHWPKEFLDDYSVQGQTVGSTIGQQVWYVFGRRAGAAGSATNTRLQLRNQRFWVWEADGSWTLYSNDANPITGPNSDAWASWHANFRSPGQETYEGISQGSGVYDWKAESSNGGGESIGGVGQGDRYGWAVHGYPIRITRTRNEWINMRGVIQSIEARLILTNGGGTDDRATSGIMSWIGGDWYNNNSSWMNEHKHARLRLVSNDWDIYGNTDIPAATLRLNKPPGWT